ncbi:ABC transporter permease [Candidatus Epulonipiscioides gigas]|nr:ABC transporter permease [Epulopiscium sp. SCG-C07WGA-EpuloA2]
MSIQNKKLLAKIFKTILLSIGAIVMVSPVLWMLSASFKYEADVFRFPIEWIPSNPTIQNYIKIFAETDYINWYINTARNTIIIVLSTLVVSSMAGFAFAKINFKFKNIIFMLYLTALMIPAEIRLIPQFVLYKNLNLINTMWAVVLPWMLFTGFSIFYMRQAFMVVPDELIEAAKIDGCSIFKIYMHICLPLIKSALVALAVLAFTWGWNDYTGPLVYIRDTDKQVLSVGIASLQTMYGANYALQMAGATLGLVPIIVIYLLGQKHFVEGIASSGIKG